MRGGPPGLGPPAEGIFALSSVRLFPLRDPGFWVILYSDLQSLFALFPILSKCVAA